jgi:hypothetical protein
MIANCGGNQPEARATKVSLLAAAGNDGDTVGGAGDGCGRVQSTNISPSR